MYTHIILETYAEQVIYCYHPEEGGHPNDAETILQAVMKERWKERNPGEVLPKVITDDDTGNYRIHLTFRGKLDPITSDDVDFYDFSGD